jgi:uncharacterized protein YdaU (DUF1376 family)
MNYFPFHIGDYASATRHLSWEEDGAYRRLLDVYYTTEKALPLDVKAVCRLVLATTETQREAVATILAEFFVQTDGGWINTRADSEILAMQIKQQQQRDKANKRWDKRRAEHGNATARETDAAASKHDADAMPPTPTPTPTPTPKIEREPRATRLATGWELPQGWGDWALNARPDLDPLKTAERFADYWHSKPGKDGRKLDWEATWRNWVREERAPRANPAEVARLTTPPRETAEENRRRLDANNPLLTPEQKEASDRARLLAMSALKTKPRIAA